MANNKNGTVAIHNRLGFSKMDMTEVVSALNKLLANYQIHYQKLRNYHWNVEGDAFFEIHGEFEKEYDAVKLNIDEIAERVRVFGKRPLSNLVEYLETAEIKETHKPISSYEMVQEIRRDFETLLSFMIDVVHAAQAVGDTATVDLINGFIKRMEKRHWMFSAYSKK